MVRTIMLGGLLLAAAAGGPYLLSNGQDILSSLGQWTTQESPGESAAAPLQAATTVESAPGTGLPGSQLPALEGRPVDDLAEVLRFDITPGWVLARWPRVATGMAHVEYQGYRVPLVTGTAPDDLAGSLTYYFNARQQVAQINFRGTTGDARKLIGLAMNRYHLVRRLTNDPGMFLYEAAGADGKVHSVLTLRSAHVVRAEDRYQRFEIEMMIRRPS